MSVLITGDVHGLTKRYVKQVKDSGCEYSLQIGDMGFNYDELALLDDNKHMFFGGNHDNYDFYREEPKALGDYGFRMVGNLKMFFIRGAYSIDMAYRVANYYSTGKISWWANEQLNREEGQAALDDYKSVKPRYMFSHTCPSEIAKIIGNDNILRNFHLDPKKFTTDTQELLQDCFDFHKPEVWVFGHFHRNLDFTHKGTRFICLDELSSIKYENKKFINTNLLDSVRQ